MEFTGGRYCLKPNCAMTFMYLYICNTVVLSLTNMLWRIWRLAEDNGLKIASCWGVFRWNQPHEDLNGADVVVAVWFASHHRLVFVSCYLETIQHDFCSQYRCQPCYHVLLLCHSSHFSPNRVEILFAFPFWIPLDLLPWSSLLTLSNPTQSR